VSRLILIRDIKNSVFAFCLNLTFYGTTWDGIILSLQKKAVVKSMLLWQVNLLSSTIM
jgi:hypothetical protein